MKDEIILFTDRIEDLESHVIQLQNKLHEQKEADKSHSSLPRTIALFTVPLMLLVIILMGLNISYQSDRGQINYSSDGLVEIGLSGLTLLSGIYSLKKYHDTEDFK